MTGTGPAESGVRSFAHVSHVGAGVQGLEWKWSSRDTNGACVGCQCRRQWLHSLCYVAVPKGRLFLLIFSSGFWVGIQNSRIFRVWRAERVSYMLFWTLGNHQQVLSGWLRVLPLMALLTFYIQSANWSQVCCSPLVAGSNDFSLLLREGIPER